MHKKLLMILFFGTIIPMQICAGSQNISVWTDKLMASESAVDIKFDDDVQLIQLPTRGVFKQNLHNMGLTDFIEKTDLITNFYGSKLTHEFADPVTLDFLVQVLEASYIDYEIMEYNKPSRVRLVNRTKPMVYEMLLNNYPIELAELKSAGIYNPQEL